jgi:tetratricopeptide (TPR) repeat protein
MILKFSGEKPEYMEANYDPNLDAPMKELISKAAENILKYTDDESLQRYYLNYAYNGEGSVQLSKYRLEKYAGDRRQEAIILADWAMGLIRMKKFDLAEVKLEEGIKKDSAVAQVHLSRGTWYMLQAKPDEALPNYQRALKLFTPQDRIMDKLRVFNNIGNSYQMKGNADSALHYYKKALEIDSKFNIIHFNMGLLYLEVKKDTASFLEYLDKSLSYGLPVSSLEKGAGADLDGVRKLQAFKDILKKYEE